MKRLSAIALLLALSVAMPAGAEVTAAPTPAPAPRTPAEQAAHLEAVSQMLASMKMPTLMRQQMQQVPTAAQEQRELFAHMSTHVSDQEILQVLTPVYASQLTTAEAQQVTAFNLSPQGQKRISEMLARPGDAKQVYSEQEVAEYRRINALPGMRNMSTAQKELTARAGQAFVQWSTGYYATYRNKAMAQVAVIMREATKSGDMARLPEPLIEPTGMATLDKVMMIIARNCVQIGLKTRAMQQDVEGYEVGKIIELDRLVSAKGIAQSRRNLSQADQRMERYLSDIMAQLQRYREEVMSFAADAPARERLENDIAPAYTLMVRLAEVQRAMFDIFGRVLDFAESRQGRLSLKDGRMVFQDEADRAPLLELMAQLQKVVVDAQQVAGDGKKMSENAIQTFSGGK